MAINPCLLSNAADQGVVHYIFEGPEHLPERQEVAHSQGLHHTLPQFCGHVCSRRGCP
ncbi:hypothetical protein DACRYDRAFT_25210 [Dacryopinax primogenitus]|uniref:Uncharacterized protein n=1 Tax=Dacryopinax primogenitus (strain DJM 731) TaxID=1858805 RepID=M5FPH1_DACPD|nr:uncharacterized protein DACRYDRAFT_25210 [Dacryopinax primogenitus]EJT97073.1 hypothetical protein DACRYDRAFT_25210 [Dacryopinax primogenitus]